MPKLVKVVNMKYDTVLTHLSNLSTSVYFGWAKGEISDNITQNDGRRYLAELILLNEKNKADLDFISDHGSFEESLNL